MGAAAESCKVYLQDLVSFRYEGHSLGNRLRGLVGPPTGAHSRSLPDGTVAILLLDGSVVTRKACDVKVVDRSYLQPGEVVGSTSHLGGQIGVVTNVTVDLDLVEHKVREEQETKIVKGVSPSRLRRVRGLSLGDYVVSGPWLGRVIEVSVDVYVLFDDGAMCKVAKAESKMLRSVATADAHYRPVMNSPFYPGQVVTGGDTGGVFKASRWLSGHWRPDRRAGTVTKVEMSGVLVYWIASAHGDQHLVQELAPPAYQNPNDLTLFCSYSDCAWGVADMCFFLATDKQDRDAGDVALAHDDNHQQEDQPSDDDYDATDDEWESPSSSSATTEAPTKKQQETSFYKKQLRKDYFDGHRRARRRGNVGRHVEPDRVPMSVFNTHSTVDVLWQDGTRQLGAPSASVVPFDILNDQEFLPGQYVVDNAFAAENVPVDASATAAAADGSRRVGFVRSLNCKDQMVHVSWFKEAASRPGQAREIDCNDTVSAYNLEREPDHCAYFGDVVVRLPPSGTPLPQGYNKKEATPDLSWVGHVVDLPHGFVQVKWGDGSTSTVLPHEIRVINEHTYEELEAEMGDWVVDDGIDLPDEPATDYTGNVPQNPTDDSNVDRDEDRADGDDPAAITTGRMSSVMWFLNGWASNVLARARGNRYLLNWSSSPLSSSELSGAAENVGAPETVPGGGDDPRNGTATEAVDAIVTSYDSSIERKEAAHATANKESFCFPRFDIVRDSPLDHHYLDTADQGSCGGKKWVKIVQREWKILQENNLPDTIYVRAFEDRMDLLRAVMVGASGTPYHDGLFFFDLQLPPSYLATPPQVYYHSFGLRLNPNLYASGTVCLSLLNTFGGEGSEVWSPETSSLLQVLVSIQGLVLNNQPYYNEAGYEALIGTPEGCRNALPYNENAYLLTLRTALHLLRRPPLGFQEFVRDHFRRRGRFILRACEAYLEGCDVGTLCSDARATEKSSERPCSRGLRSALANVVPRLVAAFAEIDDDGCV